MILCPGQHHRGEYCYQRRNTEYPPSAKGLSSFRYIEEMKRRFPPVSAKEEVSAIAATRASSSLTEAGLGIRILHLRAARAVAPPGAVP